MAHGMWGDPASFLSYSDALGNFCIIRCRVFTRRASSSSRNKISMPSALQQEDMIQCKVKQSFIPQHYVDRCKMSLDQAF
jgi:hypothetical protein